MTDTPEKAVKAAETVADTLIERGHAAQADALRDAVSHGHHGSRVLHALREACQVVLTAIEAIDPVCATMVEELRLEVDARLLEKHG